MKTNSVIWTPSVKWHATCWAVCLTVAAVLLSVLWLTSARLSAPYEPRTPAFGTTPWNH